MASKWHQKLKFRALTLRKYLTETLKDYCRRFTENEKKSPSETALGGEK